MKTTTFKATNQKRKKKEKQKPTKKQRKMKRTACTTTVGQGLATARACDGLGNGTK